MMKEGKRDREITSVLCFVDYKDKLNPQHHAHGGSTLISDSV